MNIVEQHTDLLTVLTNATSQALSTAGQTIAEVSPEVADALNLQDMTLQSIQNEVRGMLPSPSTATNEATTNGATSPETTGQTQEMQTTPNDMMTFDQLELSQAVRNFLMMDTPADADRENVITMLAERTGITPDEARTRVGRWEQYYIQVRDQAEEMARQAGETLSNVVTLFAGLLFAAMVIGAFAAGAGGFVGTEIMSRHEDGMSTKDTSIRHGVRS